jgi:hypothetical protein
MDFCCGRSEAGECSAITCAHLFEDQENDCVGLKVTQPSFEDYRDLYKASVHYRRRRDKFSKSSQIEYLISFYFLQ